MLDEKIKARAREILEKMSLSDKIGQVTQLTFNASNIEESCEMVRRIKPGSLILCWSAMGGNEQQRAVKIEHLNRLQKTAVEDTKCGIPMLFGRDVIHGHRVAFPVPLTMTASYDFDLIRSCFDAIREEAADDGINWTFSPMLDMCRDSRWGRIVEGPGEDPYLGSLYAKAAVKGFQTDDLSGNRNLIACAKHFVGYGASEGGRDYNHTEISDYALQNYYLPAFRTAVDCGVGTVMSSFNDINAIPVSGNRKILTDVLRTNLGFEGFVVSDWDAICQLYTFCGYAEDKPDAASKALKAGIDMDMVCNCYLDEIKELVSNGKVTKEELDTAVLRILETKIRFGVFDNPYANTIGYDLKSHLKLAQKIAEESIVLLKNNNILPLSKNAKLGYAGSFKDEGEELVGIWSLDYDKSLIHTIREGIMEISPKCQFFDCDDTNAYKISIKNNLDYILVILGEKRELTGEAKNVANISFSPTQKALLYSLRNAGKPIIGVLCFARPIAFGAENYLFDAILYCGHGGTCAANAIAAVLFGDAEPQGRLPFTLPYDIGQLPIYYNALPGSRKINGYYRDIDPLVADYYNCTGQPNYPFGYGLSYTNFLISNIICKKRKIKIEELENNGKLVFVVSIKNIGYRKGIAVPQLYVRDLFAQRIRPLRVLRGFDKLELEPNEEKTITFELFKKDLGYYIENGDFVIEKGDFDIYIGEDCLTENKIRITVL